MKSTKRILSLLMLIVMLAVAVLPTLVSCGEDPVEPDDPENPSNPSTGDKADYTVSVKSVGGLPLSGISIRFLYVNAQGEEDLEEVAVTNDKGIATAKLTKGNAYYVKLNGVPDGYQVDAKYNLVGSGTNIVLSSGVIQEEAPAGTIYKTGDIIHDFTVTTVQGDTFNLMEQFDQGKKAVLINFWYTTCSWCLVEFPFMENAYNKYLSDVSVVALNPYPDDSEEDVKQFHASAGYSFPMAKDTAGVDACFQKEGYPLSVMVDRYGCITLIENGALTTQSHFNYLFEHHIKDNYTQTLLTSAEELVPVAVPDSVFPSKEELDAAINNTGLELGYREEPNGEESMTWDFVIGDKDGTPVVMPANKNQVNSYAIMYVDITLKAGQALMLDYWASCEAGSDICYIIVDNEPIAQLTGLNNEWRSIAPLVALEDGTYEVAFAYTKDMDTDAGEDTVYLANFRVVNEEDVDAESYIPREAATKPNEVGYYSQYVDVFYNNKDGYYHVGDENGPILLANLMNYSNFTGTQTTLYAMALNGKLVDADNYNYYEDLLPYFVVASNSAIYGTCSVTQELKDLLVAATACVGIEGTENEWLQNCYYYSAYGTGGVQFADPAAGLADFSAFKAVESEVDDLPYSHPDKAYPNKFYYNRPIMPRGLLAAFVPEVSGVYRVVSRTYVDPNGVPAEVAGWIYSKDVTYTRELEDTLVTADFSERMWDEGANISMLMYMEAGVTYYIDIAFEDMYFVGEVAYRVERIGDTANIFTQASPGYFTFIEDPNATPDENQIVPGERIAGGIDVILGEDGYYHEKLADGSAGSIIYADFWYPTALISSHSIWQLAKSGKLDFSKSDTDEDVLNWIEEFGTGEELKAALKLKWPDDAEFEEMYYEVYKVDEVIAGIYHGDGVDMNLAFEVYESQINDGTGGNPERVGCVPVTEELAVLLQMIVDKFSFAGVDHAWTKLCYYYKHYGPSV